MAITFRSSIRADGNEFANYVTLDVLHNGVVIGQIQSVEVSGGHMRRSTAQVENGAWIAWVGEQGRNPDKEERAMRRWPSRAEAVRWIEMENDL